ncbi:alpha/beta fold hydrolase [Bacillus pseudomycoides]|uniref:alpha/beta fold hydrolase n=1 Tax=Bacillus pseudomycoides TaxID=64104 RepID=UPI00211EFD60|nr:alpha/beta hydrolase [Bacillus pseudomycoides]
MYHYKSFAKDLAKLLIIALAFLYSVLNIPLIVVTGGLQPFHTVESMATWMKFQGELANLSTNKKHIVVEDAGHAIHIDQPQVVVGVIRDILDMVKNKNKHSTL